MQALIFQDDEERREFLRRLPVELGRAHTRLLGFCLTPSDIRLLVQVSETPLGKPLQRLLSSYSRWLNRRRDTSGPVFHTHYLSAQMGTSSLLPDIVRHLHLTPVAADLVNNADRYSWSSHAAYINSRAMPWVRTAAMLRSLSRNARLARTLYRHLIDTRTAAPRDFVVGDRPYIHWIAEQQRAVTNRLSVEEVISGTCAKLGFEGIELASASRARRLTLARAVITWNARRFSGATLKIIGECLNRDPSTLCACCNRYRKRYPRLFKSSFDAFLAYDFACVGYRT